MTDGTAADWPRLAEVGETAAFLASDRASTITRTVVKVSRGSVLD